MSDQSLNDDQQINEEDRSAKQPESLDDDQTADDSAQDRNGQEVVESESLAFDSETESESESESESGQPKKQKIQQGRNWYVVHTYSGYEDTVRRNLLQRIESLGMADKIFDVVVPTQEKIKVKSGKRVSEKEKVYPGYILVNMIVDDDSWYVVRNTPRVTGFVGTGVYPVPVGEKEISEMFQRMESDTPTHHIELTEGDPVVITDGPFKDLEGKVNTVDEEQGKVQVLVPMFGRETPVELDFLQIRKI